jgi:hypothetical protein
VQVGRHHKLATDGGVLSACGVLRQHTRVAASAARSVQRG